MDVATGAMDSLLPKLGELLMEEYKLQAGVKKDVQYLRRELKVMYAALQKAGDAPRDQLDPQVRLWANRVSDLSYEMEDIVDKFLVRVDGSKASYADKPPRLKLLTEKMTDLFTKGKARREIADEIKGIKARVQEQAERGARYTVDEVVANPASTAMVDPRLPYIDRKELVGIDEPLSKLTEMLTDGDTDVSRQLKIVSIVGFGGLGKTTLAKAVYHKLLWQFDCSVFVSVGQKPSMKKLLNEILFGIDKQKHQDSILSSWDERQLIDQLRGSLATKRYFIVIDDIWDASALETIRCALVDNNCASRIVTTTRILETTRKACEVYRLQPLSHDLSKELFLTRLFGGKDKDPYDQPAEVYEEMLHKCGGVPLAIITMASLLVGKPVEVWSKVYKSIGFGYEDVDNMRKILLLSYYDLPCHLRTCLLYLAIYSEDYLIEKDSLIWKWVAEGFIHRQPGVGLYEIGEKYFNELINRSMIQPVETPHSGIITGCRVHGIIHDIICLLSKEQNFVTVLDSDEQYTTSRQNVRRVAIQHRVQPVVSTAMLQVRSLNAMCSAEMLPSLSCFQVLRVLSFEGRCDLNNSNHLEHLGRLVHLRYLRLGCMYITELPENIGHLKFLLVLDLDNMGSLNKLPVSIGLLSRLKCLNIRKCLSGVPDCIGNLTCLEELCLTNVEESSNFVTELGKLTELRKLCITQTLWLHSASSMKAWAESVAKLQKIQVIDISDVKSTGCDDATCYCWEGCVLSHKLRVLRMVYRQPKLLAKITPSVLPNLSHLSVHVDSPDLEIFGRFPELVTLCLDMPKGLHHDIMAVPGAFPKLRVLRTGATPGRFLEGAMLSLEFLDFCVQAQQPSEDGKVDDFDFGSLGNLPSLRKVAVEIGYALSSDLNRAEEAVRHAIGIFLPTNRPILQVTTYEAAHPELDLPRMSVADCTLHLHQG
ncbi:Disease resistance protein RPP13 [Hordeum vulgare]|nr:Disease resistance protein RPP13 [Hordeum vulgare]